MIVLNTWSALLACKLVVIYSHGLTVHGHAHDNGEEVSQHNVWSSIFQHVIDINFAFRENTVR